LVIEKLNRFNFMQHVDIQNSVGGRPEARYSYYRRCQVFRGNGEQCKAPAEKSTQICHAHAAQQAMALRRERERQAVLAEAVAEMRRRGRPELEAKDLLMDFNGIQVTIAKMAQALIDGRIDCTTAGRLAMDLQTMSKLLWAYHRGHRGTQREKTLTTKVTHSTPLSRAQGRSGQATEHKGIEYRESRIVVEAKILEFPASRSDYADDRDWPGQQARAA
jgi:hypothetical protein